MGGILNAKNNYKFNKNQIMKTKEFTYDVYFNDENDSNNKGFEYSLEDARGYIDSYNGTDASYFEDYKGGIVSIVCNETGETVFEVEVK